MSQLAKRGGDTASQLSDPELERFRSVLYDTEKGPFRLPKKPERFFTNVNMIGDFF